MSYRNLLCFAFRKYFLSLIVILVLIPCSRQNLFAKEPVKLTRINSEITLDGLSNESAWNNISPLPVTMYRPTYQGEQTERTEIRIAYDENFLYVSGRFYDSDPSGIHSNSLYRDRANNDDTFTLLLDTFNDKENALCFWTTPAGIRGDRAVANDGLMHNSNWNTYWDVVTVQNEDGWFAEFRIPFSSLGFKKQSEQVTFGLITYRYIDRKNEVHLYPGFSQNWRHDTPSKAQEVILENISSLKPVYFTPYILGGYGRNSELNTTETAYDTETEYDKDIGLDIKYSITNNLTIDATINTDFAQIEADNEQVNLSRFSLFFPEKRRFFQERSGIFNFNIGGLYSRDRLFHSRQIGINDEQEVRILGGVRLVGRIGPWDIGALNMHTEGGSGLPSENFGVVRLRRQMINENSYTGGIFTSRLGDNGSYNYAYGFDSILKFHKDEYLTVKWAQTVEDDLVKGKSFNFINSSVFNALWERRVMQGFNYEFSLTRSGKDFLPAIGYTTREDFTEFSWRVHYDSWPEESLRLRKYSLFQILGSAAYRNTDGTLESAWAEWGTDCSWKSGAFIWADAEIYHEDLREAIEFPDNTEIPTGSYTYQRLEVGGSTPPGRLLRSRFYSSVGSFYDGWIQSYGITPSLSFSKYFGLHANYNVNMVRFPDRDQKFNAHLISLRIEGALNNKLSMNGFIQYNSISDQLTPNIRFRYNFAEDNDFWLVYNEGFNTDREKENPVLPRTDNRTVMMKYTYTFQK